jgi:hypothetical protein
MSFELDGGEPLLGVTAPEDKLVQLAVSTVLQQIYKVASG